MIIALGDDFGLKHRFHYIFVQNVSIFYGLRVSARWDVFALMR